MPRSGTATLPLHDGAAPRWLFDRMVDLGGAVAGLVIDEYGPDTLLRRLADPYWFQAFGCALGFDWHSSGLTTTTMGALKVALDSADYGVVVAGGKGATSRRTPDEIARASIDLSGEDRDELAHLSRLSATVDNACVQDGYSLYHHTMVIAESGDWSVIQQGMNDATARRYHWHSAALDDPVCEPQTAIAAQTPAADVLDLTAATSAETSEISVDLVNDDPAHLERYLQPADQAFLSAFGAGGPGAPLPLADSGPELRLPAHHQLHAVDLSARTIDRLQRAYEVQPPDYEALIGVEGIGRGSLRALGLIAELIYEAETSHDDPAAYAYAHGGKDGTPYPVDRERYDRSIEFLQATLEGAEVDRAARRGALERLSAMHIVTT